MWHYLLNSGRKSIWQKVGTHFLVSKRKTDNSFLVGLSLPRSRQSLLDSITERLNRRILLLCTFAICRAFIQECMFCDYFNRSINSLFSLDFFSCQCAFVHETLYFGFLSDLHTVALFNHYNGECLVFVSICRVVFRFVCQPRTFLRLVHILSRYLQDGGFVISLKPNCYE